MWPHVFVDVTEDMQCFHDEVFGPARLSVRRKTLIMLYISLMLALMVYRVQFTPMTV